MCGDPSRALEAALLSEDTSALSGLTIGLSFLLLSSRSGAGWSGCPGRGPQSKSLALIPDVSADSVHLPWLP